MEADPEIGNSARNTLWLKIATGLLVFFVIGQILGLYLHAFSGEYLSGMTSFTTFLLVGMLFVNIWSLRGKSKLIGFLIGALVAFLLNFSTDFTAAYLLRKERAIDEAVAISNKGLPKLIDEETRMDSATIDHKNKSPTHLFD